MVNYNNINFNAQLGEKIRQARKIKKISLSHLARQMQISYQQLQKYETGTNRISAEKLAQIAQILDVEIAAFFADNAEIIDKSSFSTELAKKVNQLHSNSQRLIADLAEHFAKLERLY